MPIRLAIVDDHEMLRDGLKARFEGKDDFAIVGEGATGKDAIALYEELVPDILLCDIQMPIVNGLEAAEAILQTNNTARIIFLSVYDDPQYVAEAVRIGAKGFVLKDLRGGCQGAFRQGRRIGRCRINVLIRLGLHLQTFCKRTFVYLINIFSFFQFSNISLYTSFASSIWSVCKCLF